MERDQQTLSAIQNTEQLLQNKGVRTRLWIVNRPHIHAHFFSDELPLTELESEELYYILLDNELLDNKGLLIRNPRSSRLTETLLSHFSQPQLLTAHMDSITELMNVAFGFHEFTASNANQIMRWIRGLK